MAFSARKRRRRMIRKPLAIYAITRHGLSIANRLLEHLSNADLYVSQKLRGDAPSTAQVLPLPFAPILQKTFPHYDCHIFIVSIGAVVRMIAPLLESKKVDPAVVCIDDAAQFAVCVLSGHVGRGNAFTERIAEICGARAVITTASDVLGTLTVDILGRDLGWSLDDPDRNVTKGCATVVNSDPVAFIQEAGEPEWWPQEKALPQCVRYFAALDAVDPDSFEILLVASDREFRESYPRHWAKAVVYRPKTLIVGVGCDRGADTEMVQRGVARMLQHNALSSKCVKAIATIDKKRDEISLVTLAASFNCPLLTFSAQELDAVPAIENPSETVRFFVGTRGVAEPAALLAAGATKLLVPKQIYTEEGAGRSMTVAAARIPFPRRDSVAA